MMWINVVIWAVVFVMRAEGRSIGDFISSIHIRLPSDVFPPHSNPLHPQPPSFSPSKPTADSIHSLPICRFTPHPGSSPSDDLSIPSHAWPHISTLLTSNTQNLLSPSPPDRSHRSRVHTLRLKDIVDDVSLEGVVVGLVYTAPDPSDRELELRDEEPKAQRSTSSSSDLQRFRSRGPEDEEAGGQAAKKCLSEAILAVHRERVMEGVLGLPGGKGGKVGFLVYRVD